MPHTLRLMLVSLLAVVLYSALACGQTPAPSGGKLRPEIALQIGHRSSVNSVAFSPDGKLLASGSDDYTIKLWDVASGILRCTLSGHDFKVHSVAFSPDGKILASGSDDNTIKLWDVASGTLRRTLTGHKDQVNSVTFSTDGKLLASGSGDSTIKLWDVASGALRRTLSGHKHEVNSVAFSADGKLLASGGEDSTIKLWDVGGGTLHRTLTGHKDWVNSVAFSLDGKLLASGGVDNNIKLWDVASGALHRTLSGRDGEVNSVAFSADGKLLASSSRGSAIRLWDVTSGKIRRNLGGHEDLVHLVAFSPDAKLLASGGEDSTIKLWDIVSGTLQRTLKGYDSRVRAVAFSSDSKLLATGSTDSTIKLWNVTTGTLQRTLRGHERSVYSVAFSPDGKLLASSSVDNTIRLWDVVNGTLQRTLSGQNRSEWAPLVAFSPDGKLLASGSGDESVPPGYHTLSRDDALASSEMEGDTQFSVKLWDVASGTLRRTPLSGHKQWVHSVAFSSDGKLLASSSVDNTIRLWDVVNGTLQRTLSGHKGPLGSVAFSPNGKLLVSGGYDGTIKLWDVASGTLQRTLSGHKERLGSFIVSFSPDGKSLASNSANTIRLWDVASGTLRRTLIGHEDWVSSVVFSADGKLLASGSDGTGLWQARSQRLLARLLTLPEVAEQIADNAKALSMGAKALTIGAKAIEAASGEWFITTPQGWFDCSANAAQFIRWRVNNQVVPAERYYRVLRNPEMVQKALRGEAVPEPDLSNLDIPPQAHFTRVQYDGDKAAESVTATLEVRGRRDMKEVTVLVNGRPLPPENEAPLQVSDVPADLEARPLDIGAKPLDLGVRALDIGARPLSIGARPVGALAKKDTRYTVAKRYTFKVPLPIGAKEIKLRAFAYDTKELGSNPTEVTLRRPDAKRVAGNLYILCAGIGTYRNGSDGKAETATGFSNLKFSAQDAQSLVERLKTESAPLYEKVEVFNGGPLVNAQATLANLRAGLKWLQGKARPGQIDTVVIFLSGHGLSDPQGRYYFPAYEFDKANWQNTSLSGKELQQELGGKLRARSVFLFVDTCHSGALAGARSDDLNFEVNSSGVYMLASSGSTQYSYESDKWGHGAFTLALLNSLKRKELAPDGTIRFNVLTYAVPDEIAKLMKEAGQSESAMAPVVPLEGRRLDEPVAQVK